MDASRRFVIHERLARLASACVMTGLGSVTDDFAARSTASRGRPAKRGYDTGTQEEMHA
jgi:hypothetical protein